MTAFSKAALPLAALGAILLGAAFLRFSGLRDQGFYLLDEAWAANRGAGIAGFARALGQGRQAMYGEIRRTGGVWHLTVAKPAYLVLAAAAYGAAPGRELPLLALNGLLGLGTILILFEWGRRWLGLGAGLAAAGLLAGLGGHVWYCRTGLSVACAAFWLALGAYGSLFAARRGPAAAGLSGVCLGLAMSSHYNTLPSIGLLLLALSCFRESRRAAAGAGLGLITTLAAWQLAYLFRNGLSPHPLPSYFAELRQQLLGGGASLARPLWEPGIQLRWLAASSGWAAAACLAAGAVLAAPLLREKRARPESVLPALLGPCALALWALSSLRYVPVARTAGPLLPFLCLWAAAGWDRAARPLEKFAPGRVQPALALLLLLSGASYSRLYARCRSPYARAAEWLGKSSCAYLGSSMSVFYQEPGGGPVIPAGSAPARYLLLDWHDALDPGRTYKWLPSGEPTAAFPLKPLPPRLIYLEDPGMESEILRLGAGRPFADGVAIYPLAEPLRRP